MRSSLLFALPLVLGCGSGGTDDSVYPPPGGTIIVEPPTVTVDGDVCDLGDANGCVPLLDAKLYTDVGVCLRLVFENQCDSESFADTCIEHQDPSTDSKGHQCWTSSVLPGFTIDVSECQVTGRYFFVSTKSSGQLDIQAHRKDVDLGGARLPWYQALPVLPGVCS